MAQVIGVLIIIVLVLVVIAFIIMAIIWLAMALLIGLPSAVAGVGTVFSAQWISRKLYATSSTNLAEVVPFLAGASIGAATGFLTVSFLNQWGALESQGDVALVTVGFVASGVLFVLGCHYANKIHVRKMSELSAQHSQTGRLTRPEPSEPETSTSLPNGHAGERSMIKKLMCPYCLAQDTIAPTNGTTNRVTFTCRSAECGNHPVPLEYVNSPSIPRVVVSAVGFRGHGKSVYFAALFHSLDVLANFWPGFYTFPVDEESLRTVKRNIEALEEGHLPDSTPMQFPAPTVVRFSRLPGVGNRFFMFYDTSGEAYRQAGSLIQHAKFVVRSRSVMFMVSLDDLEKEGDSVHNLLSAYVQGLGELGGSTRDQHLVVVLSKGDRLEPKLSSYPQVWSYLTDGSLDQFSGISLKDYTGRMKVVSRQLRKFVRDEIKAVQFSNFAEDRFKSVEFSIVSALGEEPDGFQLRSSITPKRILDPLLWIMTKS